MMIKYAIHICLLIIVYSALLPIDAHALEKTDKELVVQTDAISVRIALVFFSEKYPCTNPSSWAWGVEHACPATGIGTFQVSVDGSSMFVPLSSISDLGNIRNIYIERSTEKYDFSVIIEGGDAALSYRATLTFVKRMLRQRTVRSGEFPDDAYEETRYVFNQR